MDSLNIQSYYSTNSYRLSAALVANGHDLLHVRLSNPLEGTQYFFKDSKRLRDSISDIENCRDRISSRDLYTATDYLTRRIQYEHNRTEFENNLDFNDIKK